MIGVGHAHRRARLLNRGSYMMYEWGSTLSFCSVLRSKMCPLQQPRNCQTLSVSHSSIDSSQSLASVMSG